MDRATVERARRGDIDAFEDLIRSHTDAVYRFSLAIMGSDAEARDATQETFLAAWRQVGRLRDPDRFEAWLRRIALNSCRMALRSRRRVREVRLVEAATRPAHGGLDREEQLAFDAAFERLSADERAVLTLHHLEGRPVAEIASLLEIPPGTVKSRLFAARRTLQRELTREAR